MANANIPNASILTIDTADLMSMYERLLPVDNNEAANRERTSICSFGFTSEMMRGLKLSQEVYRNLTLGR